MSSGIRTKGISHKDPWVFRVENAMRYRPKKIQELLRDINEVALRTSIVTVYERVSGEKIPKDKMALSDNELLGFLKVIETRVGKTEREKLILEEAKSSFDLAIDEVLGRLPEGADLDILSEWGEFTEKITRGARPPHDIDPIMLKKVINKISADSEVEKGNEKFMKLISDYFKETGDLPSVIEEGEAE
jgi:hypothetical protein